MPDDDQILTSPGDFTDEMKEQFWQLYRWGRSEKDMIHLMCINVKAQRKLHEAIKRSLNDDEVRETALSEDDRVLEHAPQFNGAMLYVGMAEYRTEHEIIVKLPTRIRKQIADSMSETPKP